MGKDDLSHVLSSSLTMVHSEARKTAGDKMV